MQLTGKTVSSSMPTAIDTIYEIPSGKMFHLKNIRLVNRSSNARAKVWLYLVPSGDSAGDANLWYSDAVMNMEKGQFVNDEFFAALAAGDTIQGYTTGSVTIHLAGLLETV